MKKIKNLSESSFLKLFFAFVAAAFLIAAACMPDRADMFAGLRRIGQEIDDNRKSLFYTVCVLLLAAIQALADKYTELATDHKNGTIFISHGDCEDEAKLLASMIKEQHGAETQVITFVGPVIGSHSGPGTIALFFVGEERK